MVNAQVDTNMEDNITLYYVYVFIFSDALAYCTNLRHLINYTLYITQLKCNRLIKEVVGAKEPPSS